MKSYKEFKEFLNEASAPTPSSKDQIMAVITRIADPKYVKSWGVNGVEFWTGMDGESMTLAKKVIAELERDGFNFDLVKTDAGKWGIKPSISGR